MGTKKEIKIAIAKAKAIEGGFTPSVADNVFRMQMNDPSRTQNTPGIFKAKDQKVMAMSTMYNTHDPDGATPIPNTVTFGPRIAGQEPLTATQVSTGFSGGGVFENQDQKNWYDKQIAQRTAAGMTQDQAIQDYRNTFKIGEEQFKTELSGGETKYANNPFGAFSQNYDDVVSTDKKKTSGGPPKSGGSGGDGMVDTFTSYDTRQAGRKAIVEGRKAKQAAIREARAEMKADNIDRKEFRKRKKAAKLAQAKARTKAMEKITKQGEAQRSAGKNPATSTEFDPNQAAFPMKVMQFRKKNKK